ncbi:MAG: ABC transporter ATP-binding protein [Thermoplasmata archaeon]|nr:ABC transporter ATP-binding protein [Thermoplasmata archaeon]
MILRAEGIVQGYGDKIVLDGIDLEAESGQLVTVLGPNGCGKSTLIKTLCGIYSPRAGTVTIDGEDVITMERKARSRLISYVPQDYTSGGHSSVYDTVLMGRRPYIEWTYSQEDVAICADAILKMKMENYVDSFINQLSGGQLQRVVIARSLAQDPDFYIFDEPTSAFDMRNQLDLMRIMKAIIRDKGASLVVALHDINLAMRYSDKVLAMKDGKIYASGPPEEVITPTMLKEVYNVSADVVETVHGRYVHIYDNDGEEMADGYRFYRSSPIQVACSTCTSSPIQTCPRDAPMQR